MNALSNLIRLKQEQEGLVSIPQPKIDNQLAALMQGGGNFIRNDQTGNVIDLGQGSPRPRFTGSPVDVFGQGKGYMQPNGTIRGVNQAGQNFRVQPEGTNDAQIKARLAAEDRAMKIAEFQMKQKIAQTGLDKLNNAQGAGGKPANLSATAQKELFEAEDISTSSKNALGMLQEAINLNDKAYSGYTAKPRAFLASNIPFVDVPKGADATVNLDNLMTGQALESLKSTFGGMPTEGERKILLEMQASVDKTPAQRKLILERAVNLANARLKFNDEKAKKLRSGMYFSEQPANAPTVQSNPHAEAIAWARANPNDPRSAKILSLHGQ